ncbi:hypothetical protein AB6G19_02150 [Providencia manganoxydans]
MISKRSELLSEFYKLGEVKKAIGSGAINTRFFVVAWRGSDVVLLLSVTTLCH